MSRPRSVVAGEGLPRHMFAEAGARGVRYRMQLPGGPKIHLGRDRTRAIEQFHVFATPTPERAVPADPVAIWKRHAKGARQRRIPFALTVDDVTAMLERQRHRCAVTGLPFRDDKPDGQRMRPWAASLDRIDHKGGYDVANVRVVCAFVNVAMNGFGELNFRAVLESLIDAAVKARLAQFPNQAAGVPKLADEK